MIASEFENRMKQTIMHKEIGRQVSYQYLMRLECYKLIKHLLGEKEYRRVQNMVVGNVCDNGV